VLLWVYGYVKGMEEGRAREWWEELLYYIGVG
jgi:hypothetical protein